MPESFARTARKKNRRLREAIARCIELLADNPHHPGLHVHRISGSPGVYGARVDQANRVTFHWDEGRSHRQIRAQVLAEERTCWLCGEPGTLADPLTLDHVVPLSVGGPTTRTNGRAAHMSCNSRRGAKTRGGGGQ